MARTRLTKRGSAGDTGESQQEGNVGGTSLNNADNNTSNESRQSKEQDQELMETMQCQFPSWHPNRKENKIDLCKLIQRMEGQPYKEGLYELSADTPNAVQAIFQNINLFALNVDWTKLLIEFISLWCPGVDIPPNDQKYVQKAGL